MSNKNRLFRALSQPAYLKQGAYTGSETAQDLFANLPTLGTDRLILRKLTMRDAHDIYAYSHDPEVARYVLWDAHENIAQTRSYLRFILRQYHSAEPGSYGIILKETGQVIGTIGFMWYNEENRSAEVGYSLSRAYWGMGIMTEALKAIIDFGFRRLRLNRIEAQHDTRNPASGKVMLHCGMVKEGTLHQRIYNKGRYVDVDIYAIVSSNYK